MSIFAALSRTSSVGQPLRGDVDEFLDLVVGDLPSDDITGRLKRLSYVRDRLSLAFSKEAARLSAEFRESETANRLDAPTAGEWIRHNCKMKSAAAYDCISVGEQLPRITNCAQAMVIGEIGFAHLWVIARTASALSSSTTESVFQEDDILAHARESSAGRLWHYCQRLRHALDPAGVEQDHRVAVEERRLELTVWEDGSLQISGKLDPVGGAALRTALEPLAQPMGEGDDRCIERRLGDGLVELSLHSLDAGLVPQHASQCQHLQVTTSLETLQALPGSPAADMEFSTPISAVTLQRLACDANVARVVFGPDSVVVDVGRAVRVVSGATRRALNARDRHCRWPGCERTASWSSAHHVVHWTQGGKTDLSNLLLLCHRHHWMVHEGGWKLARSDDDRVLAIPPVYDYWRAPQLQPSSRQ
jgi:hypothetical protein